MLIIYTGNGKGKTSASVGQAVRAYGQGFRVSFGQFMKRPNQAGEQKILRQLLGDRFQAGGRGFFRKEEDREDHRRSAADLLAWAKERLEDSDMLVLDEALYALGSGLLTEDELLDCVKEARSAGVHLVLSGRGLTGRLRAEADLITEMGEIKHPYANGMKAERGIEF